MAQDLNELKQLSKTDKDFNKHFLNVFDNVLSSNLNNSEAKPLFNYMIKLSGLNSSEYLDLYNYVLKNSSKSLSTFGITPFKPISSMFECSMFNDWIDESPETAIMCGLNIGFDIKQISDYLNNTGAHESITELLLILNNNNYFDNSDQIDWDHLNNLAAQTKNNELRERLSEISIKFYKTLTYNINSGDNRFFEKIKGYKLLDYVKPGVLDSEFETIISRFDARSSLKYKYILYAWLEKSYNGLTSELDYKIINFLDKDSNIQRAVINNILQETVAKRGLTIFDNIDHTILDKLKTEPWAIPYIKHNLILDVSNTGIASEVVKSNIYFDKGNEDSTYDESLLKLAFLTLLQASPKYVCNNMYDWLKNVDTLENIEVSPLTSSVLTYALYHLNTNIKVDKDWIKSINKVLPGFSTQKGRSLLIKKLLPENSHKLLNDTIFEISNIIKIIQSTPDSCNIEGIELPTLDI